MLRFDPGKMPFHWYKTKNHSSCSIGNFNCRIMPCGDELEAGWWLGVYCYEKTEHKETARFAMSEEGLAEAWAWLEEKFHACDVDELEKTMTILDAAPYEAPKEEAPE